MRINRFLTSIRGRMILSYTALIMVAFAVISVIVMRIVEDYLLTQRLSEQTELAQSYSVQSAQYLYNRDASALYRFLSDNGRDSGSRLLVINNYGVVESDSFALLNGYRLDHLEVREILSNQTKSSYGFHRLTVDTGTARSRQWVVYHTVSMEYEDQRVGVLLMSQSIQDVIDRSSGILNQLVVLTLVEIVAVTLIIMVMSGVMVKPIQNLTVLIRQMSSGNYNQRLEISGTSELGELAQAFNTMSARLGSIENARNEFVSNASHELKTPLSSIKILVESMLYQEQIDEGMTREFLQDINKEIDRLNNVITELLALVHMDQNARIFKSAPVNLCQIAREVSKHLLPLAKQKGMTLELSASSEEIWTEGDGEKLQQMLMNLVDNGIKYSDEGDKVRIDISVEQNMAHIVVEDNGIGIPEQDLPYIFERFYRVDKARSRGTGGTGLGLSIVEGIINLHQGFIRVEAAEGEGTRFIVDLPVAERKVLGEERT